MDIDRTYIIMSVNEFLMLLSRYHVFIIGYFILIPVLALLAGFTYRPSFRLTFRDYLFSVLVYLAGVPGMLSASLLFYSFFIIRKNILEMNVLFYVLPLISMAIVFLLIGRKTDYDRLPGFGRLWGLMLIMALVCIIVLFLYRLRFFIGFFASIQSLLIIAVIIFFLFKFAGAKITARKN
jgi:hypothetical protein